jgi:hypothetical protein
VRRSHTPIATLAAIFLVAILVAGCGGDSNENDRAVTQASTTAQNGDDENGTDVVDTDTESNGDGNPCDETPCSVFRKRKDGGTFLCTRLEVVPVPAEETEATEAGEPDETSEVEPSETPSETVLRPRCPAGAREIPVEGLDLEELPDVRVSEDGEAAWTEPVRVEGRIEDGTFVPDE